MAPSFSCDRLWTGARLATLAPHRVGVGAIERGAIAVREGRIVFAGAEADLPTALRNARETIACDGRWITPGLIDCHTHLVHAGNRAGEFEMRLRGASYEEIARAGGGIVSSVKALRAASEDELVRQSLPRLDALIGEGVTTVEIKSGYGLDLPNERKSLLAAGRMGRERPVIGPTNLSRRPRAAARVRGRQDRLYRGDRDGDAARPRPRRAGRRRRRLLRRHRVLAGGNRARVRGGARARAAREAARRSALQSARRGAGGALRRAFGRPSRTYRRRRRSGDGARGNDRRNVARAPTISSARRRRRRSRCFASMAFRWRSPPTAIPALRR